MQINIRLRDKFGRHGTFHITFSYDQITTYGLDASESSQERSEVFKLEISLVKLYECLCIVKE